MNRAKLAVALLTLSTSVFAMDEDTKNEIYDIAKNIGYKYCFSVINNNPERQSALNQLKISPSTACQCASIESANAMEASPSYNAFIRSVIRSSDINNGRKPSFVYEKDQDAAVEVYSKIFNNSWANCVMRLK